MGNNIKFKLLIKMEGIDVQAILNDEAKLKEVVKKAFEGVDEDGSGFIEEKELKIVMTQVATDLGIPEPSDDEVKDVLKELDTNKDGKISEEEFAVLIKQVMGCMG